MGSISCMSNEVRDGTFIVNDEPMLGADYSVPGLTAGAFDVIKEVWIKKTFEDADQSIADVDEWDCLASLDPQHPTRVDMHDICHEETLFTSGDRFAMGKWYDGNDGSDDGAEQKLIVEGLIAANAHNWFVDTAPSLGTMQNFMQHARGGAEKISVTTFKEMNDKYVVDSTGAYIADTIEIDNPAIPVLKAMRDYFKTTFKAPLANWWDSAIYAVEGIAPKDLTTDEMKAARSVFPAKEREFADVWEAAWHVNQANKTHLYSFMRVQERQKQISRYVDGLTNIAVQISTLEMMLGQAQLQNNPQLQELAAAAPQQIAAFEEQFRKMRAETLSSLSTFERLLISADVRGVGIGEKDKLKAEVEKLQTAIAAMKTTEVLPKALIDRSNELTATSSYLQSFLKEMNEEQQKNVFDKLGAKSKALQEDLLKAIDAYKKPCDAPLKAIGDMLDTAATSRAGELAKKDSGATKTSYEIVEEHLKAARALVDQHVTSDGTVPGPLTVEQKNILLVVREMVSLMQERLASFKNTGKATSANGCKDNEAFVDGACIVCGAHPGTEGSARNADGSACVGTLESCAKMGWGFSPPQTEKGQAECIDCSTITIGGKKAKFYVDRNNVAPPFTADDKRKGYACVSKIKTTTTPTIKSPSNKGTKPKDTHVSQKSEPKPEKKVCKKPKLGESWDDYDKCMGI